MTLSSVVTPQSDVGLVPRKTNMLTLDRVTLLQDVKLDRNVCLQSTRHGAVIWAV